MSPSPCARRRRFLASSLAALGAAPFAASRLVPDARAADLTALPADNATAVALVYTEDATSAKHPTFKPGSLCSNCQFFSGDAAAARGPCSLFPGFSVSSKGWCSAWARKA